MSAKGIFINYRREDSIGYAGRIYDRLSARFGKDRVFMDIDTISPGDDFRHTIEQTCDSSAIVLALIAKSWSTIADRNGRRRLDNPRDFVRLELSRALATGLRVIPVLLDEADMPDPDSLPDDLKDLAYRHAIPISSLRFHHDVDRMIEVVEKALARLEVSAPSHETQVHQPRQPSPENIETASSERANSNFREHTGPGLPRRQETAAQTASTPIRQEPATLQSTSHEPAAEHSTSTLRKSAPRTIHSPGNIWLYPFTRWHFWLAVAVWPAAIFVVCVFGPSSADLADRYEVYYDYSFADAIVRNPRGYLFFFAAAGLIVVYVFAAVRNIWAALASSAAFSFILGGLGARDVYNPWRGAEPFSHALFVLFHWNADPMELHRLLQGSRTAMICATLSCGIMQWDRMAASDSAFAQRVREWLIPFSRWRFWAAAAVWPAAILAIRTFASSDWEGGWNDGVSLLDVILASRWGAAYYLADYYKFLLFFTGGGLIVAYVLAVVRNTWASLISAAALGFIWGGLGARLFFSPYRETSIVTSLSVVLNWDANSVDKHCLHQAGFTAIVCALVSAGFLVWDRMAKPAK